MNLGKNQPIRHNPPVGICCEAGEQRGGIRRGVSGAKDGDQGECGPTKHTPGSVPGKCVTGVGTHTASFAVKYPRWEPYASRCTYGSVRGARGNSRPLYVADCLANKQILPSSEGNGEPLSSLWPMSLCGRLGPSAGQPGFYVRAYCASSPPHTPDMLTVRIQAIDGTGSCTLLDFQPCRLLRFTALRSSAGVLQHCKSLQLRIWEAQLWFQ